MRPIDADALKDFYLSRPQEDFSYNRQFTAEDVALRIEKTPTIDTVKHGKWRSYHHSRFYGYDEWGDPIWRDGGQTHYHRRCGWRSVVKTPYCPKCGRKMDLRLDEDEID